MNAQQHVEQAEHHLTCANDYKPTAGNGVGDQARQWNVALHHATLAAAHASLAAAKRRP